jgi:endonuclease YncB( thermonuclease family)
VLRGTIALAFFSLLLACSPVAAPNTASTGQTLDSPHCSTVICCPDCPTTSVKRVIDGDTFDSGSTRIRLFGVDTPERGDKCFNEATNRFTELAGDSVRVESGPRQGDRYGRILYYVYTEGGESIDETLVREGLALAWTQDGQHRDLLVAMEAEAREDGSGCLW